MIKRSFWKMQDFNKKTEVEYNHGAEDYVKQRDEIPFYQCVEIPSTLKIIGSLNGKSCLDLACGTGVYPRLYKKHNASKVVGIDISDAMIDIAKSYEQENKQDIQYTAADVLNMGHIDNFDIITGIQCILLE
jgi:toxoflavin synthase